MSEWQLIETAPKDRGYLLVFDVKSPWREKTEESMWLARWDGYNWKIMLDGQSCWPTHWMLPPPPPIMK